MMHLKRILKHSSLFSLILALSAGFAFYFGQNYRLVLNSHPTWLNIFFINYSFMGDAVFIAGLIIFLVSILKDRSTALTLFVGFLLTEMVVQLLKNNFSFAGFRLFTEQGQYLFNTGKASEHEIISGHTALAFLISTVFVIQIKNKYWQLPIFFAASLLAISRMYLAQNSIAEITLGAITGSLSALTVVCCLANRKNLKIFLTRDAFKQRAKNTEASRHFRINTFNKFFPKRMI